MKVSIVIRTYNEAKHLRALLEGVQRQELDGYSIEIVLVDSGSTDGTTDIAAEFPVKIVPIRKEDFSFGRSLNVGCAVSTGDVLVFVSGHCIPVGTRWIANLVEPLGRDRMVYSYGGQIGDQSSNFSERQIFGKYFPAKDKLPQEGFFCNNANAALLKSVWERHPFDEDLTGLEDMHLAKALVSQGYAIGYVANATVYHLHSENWTQVRLRFEREAIALQQIMPQVQLALIDVVRYFFSAVMLDTLAALQQKEWRKHASGIIAYRFQQFSGAFRGNHSNRRMSRKIKEAYFYPR